MPAKPAISPAAKKTSKHAGVPFMHNSGSKIAKGASGAKGGKGGKKGC